MIEISDHACLRYLERVKGIDIEAIKAEMRSPGLQAAEMFGSPVVIGRHGERLVIKDGVVVTVVEKQRGAGRRIRR